MTLITNTFYSNKVLGFKELVSPFFGVWWRGRGAAACCTRPFVRCVFYVMTVNLEVAY